MLRYPWIRTKLRFTLLGALLLQFKEKKVMLL